MKGLGSDRFLFFDWDVEGVLGSGVYISSTSM